MKYRKRASVCFFVLFTAITLVFASRVQSAQSPVFVYNSFGPANSYVTIADFGVIGASAGGFVGHAEYFVPSISGNLYSLQVPVGLRAGGTGLVNFSVALDNGGTPGATLESFSNVLASSPSSVVTINSITEPLLQA